MRRSLLALLAFGAAGRAFAGADEVPRIPMPEEAYRALSRALGSYPFGKHRRDDWLKQNREALEHLRAVPWPDLSKLERVRLTYQKEEKGKKQEKTVNMWRLPGEGDETVLLMPDFTERRVKRDSFTKMEVVDYGDELAELVKYLEERDPDSRRPWDFTYIWDFGSAGLPFNGGVFQIHHAYGAAIFGKQEETETLVHEALRQRGLAFKRAYDEGAWQSFFVGIKLLQEDVPRADVLAQFERTLTVYGQSRYREQLLDLLGELRKQVEEDKRLKASEVDDPEKLPVEERIRYYVARFPDVRGAQWSQPGHCMTLRMGDRTKFSDAIVKIGRPAVPTLMEHLTDRQVTRSIGYWRNFAPHRTVLRVQDVAVQCIEAILEVNFYNASSTSSYLSNEDPKKREKVIAGIKSWWKENGHKSPLEGHLARLEHGRLYDRLATLRKIEKIDPKAVDPIAVLKRWAVDVDFRELPRIASALATRGDLSLLPAMRRMMSEPKREVPSGCVWFVLEHGGAEDYRFLREAARKDIEAGARLGTSRIFGSVKAGVENSSNPLAVPILVDFLDHRDITGSRWISKEKGSMSFSCADKCLGALIRLTGHNEGYERGDAVEKRYAAIDRWIAWWEREGKAAYLKQHPEVGRVLENEGTPVNRV
ncbi:MAG: hypothetical protein ACYTFI_07475, partial [Planctomycetota bacterium]